MDLIYCLNLSGAPLSLELNRALCVAAGKMIRNDQKTSPLKGTDFEGRLTATGRRIHMAAFRGNEFLATIESEIGKTEVCFILEDGAEDFGNDFRVEVTDLAGSYSPRVH